MIISRMSALVAVVTVFLSITAAAQKDSVLVGAGDIASCDDLSGAEATAKLIEKIPGTVFAAGDLAYPDGSDEQFAKCYGPTWGRFKDRTRPAAGNHEYHSDGASGYVRYFGDAAGDPKKAYYSYDLDAWHIIVLNSECQDAGGCGVGSQQEQWLRQDLSAHPTRCTLAYWHQPLYSPTNGISQEGETSQAFWQLLYEYGADLVLKQLQARSQAIGLRVAEFFESGQCLPPGRVRGARSTKLVQQVTNVTQGLGFAVTVPGSAAHRQRLTVGLLCLRELSGRHVGRRELVQCLPLGLEDAGFPDDAQRVRVAVKRRRK